MAAKRASAAGQEMAAVVTHLSAYKASAPSSISQGFRQT